MSDPLTREQLIRAIELAFAEVRRGDGTTLHEALAIDYCVSDRKRRAERRKDTDVRWTDVPDARMAVAPQALCFMDAEALHYYLPAYMRHALFHPESEAADAALLRLASIDGHDAMHEVAQRFTDAQRKTVAQFVEYIAYTVDGSEKVAERALRKYWAKFLSD